MVEIVEFLSVYVDVNPHPLAFRADFWYTVGLFLMVQSLGFMGINAHFEEKIRANQYPAY